MKRFFLLAGLVAVMLGTAGPVRAITYDLCVDELNMTMPDGAIVGMWGYGLVANDNSCNASVPGPELTVPENDSTLSINLRNDLTPLTNENITRVVSVVASGLPLPAGGSPVMVPGTNRVRSFTTETLPGASNTYTFNNVRPGTFLYSSGTHPAVQVQMGLYGAVTKNAGGNTAYSGVSFDAEALVVLSEIDSALHSAVATGTYGTTAYPSTINYVPDYFLVNGVPDGSEIVDIAPPGQISLIRMLNAGLDNRSMVLQGGHMDLIAEDGNQYPYPRQQYSILMAAGKTRDAVFVADVAGEYPLYDRRLSSGLKLKLSASTPVAGPVANDDTGNSVDVGGSVVVAVLDNDTSDNGFDSATLEVVEGPAHGTVVVDTTNGTITYTPDANFNDVDSFGYRVSDNAGNPSNIATVIVSVDDLPIAVADDFTVESNSANNVLQVLTNDYDLEGDSFAVVSVSDSADGATSTDGAVVIFTPNAGFEGDAIFNYTITGGNGAEVTVIVEPASTNQPPTAVNDSYTVLRNSGTTSFAVLSNDSDPENQALTLDSIVSGPSHGSASISGNQIQYTTATDHSGQVSLIYSVSDSESASSTAEVTITVANSPPVANDDYTRVTRNNGNSGNSVDIDILVNDSDDIALVSNTVTVLRTPRKGTLTIDANGMATYQPNAGKRGSDTFSYTVEDNEGAVSNEAVVLIDIVK